MEANNWTACAVKICHDGMLEDTNSLDGAHIITGYHSTVFYTTLSQYEGHLKSTWHGMITLQCVDRILVFGNRSTSSTGWFVHRLDSTWRAFATHARNA